jgi:hypothetical protein
VADLFLSGYGMHVTAGWLMIVSGITGEAADINIPRTVSPSAGRIDYNRKVIERSISELKSHIEPYWGSL